MSAKQSKNHHWLPQSLMRPWEGSDHLVESFSIQPWGLSSRRKSTKALGSQANLHRIELLEEANYVEDIFGKIESSFIDVKRKSIDEGVSALNFDERESFAFFLALLTYRRGDRIEAASDQARGDLSRDSGPKIANVDTIEAEQIFEGLGRYLALRAAMEFAASLCPNIVSLEWRIIEFSSVSLKLVLADRPLRIWGENIEHITRLTIPLGPDHLFVASQLPNSDETIFREQFRELLAVQIVGEQFRQAANFVVARTREPYLKLAKKILNAPHQKPSEGAS